MVYDENELIGRRLRKVRTSHKLEYCEMARILGISEGHYRKIERGLYPLDVHKLMLLYKKLNVDPLYLLVGKVDLPNVYMTVTGASTEKEMICELLEFCICRIREGVGGE